MEKKTFLINSFEWLLVIKEVMWILSFIYWINISWFVIKININVKSKNDKDF